MKKLCGLFAGIFLLTGSVSASIHIVENSATRLRFSWDLGSIDSTTQLDSQRLSTLLSFTGENISLGDIGEPVVPGYSFFAGIPSTGAVRVRLTAGLTRRLALSHPLKIHRRVAGEPQLPSLQKDFQFLDPWISEPRYTAFRDLRAVQLVIRPVRYVPGAASVELLQTGECTVEFPAGQSFGAGTGSGDYQKMLKGLLLNYTVARSWAAKRQGALRKSLTSGSDAFPFDYTQTVKTFTIGDGHNGMNEGTIKENGILKLSGAQVLSQLGMAPGALAMSQVALYASVKGELPERIPELGGIPAGVVEIPLLRVDRNRDGLVDADDFFLAYVTGLNDWAYDSLRKDFVYNTDNYDDNRHYYFTVKRSGAGATMRIFTQPSSGDADTLDSFTNRARFKELNYRPVSVENCVPTDQDGLGWVWQQISTMQPFFSCVLDLPGLDPTAGGLLHLRTFYPSSVMLNVSISGTSIASETNISEGDLQVADWGNRTLKIQLSNATPGCEFWQLDYAEALYRTKLNAGTGPLRMHVFPSLDTLPKYYRFSGIGSDKVYIFRIPDDESAVSLIDTVSGKANFVWTDSIQNGARFLICNEAGFITLGDDKITLRNRKSDSSYFRSRLRDASNESGYLIITPPAFFSQAIKLADHKSKVGIYKPVVVNVNDVYTDFSGGNVDPVAIRNFLAYARRNWTNNDSLNYVVLFGEGNYDYKGVLTKEQNFIPPYERGNLCVEDFYCSVEPGGSESEPSFALGRIPCLDSTEALAIIHKTIETEDPKTADWGAWRNGMLFIADDDMQGNIPDGINGNINGHHASSDRTASLVESQQPSMDIKKVYEFEYPWNATLEKPDASRAYINVINNGVAYVNFFGHGAAEVWTDEHIMTLSTGPRFFNDMRYPIISSFSCSVGKFDRPNASCLSEMLIKLNRAGAAATFSATRLATASSNEDLAKNVYAKLFDSTGRQSIGMAILSAKSQNHDGNNLVYSLLGDPALSYVKSNRQVRLEIDTADDGTTSATDTLKALQRITIKGTVLDGNGSPDNAFGSSGNAYVQLGMLNPSYMTTRKDGGKDTTVRYMLPGAPIFSGKLQVRNGVFSQKAIIPLGVELDQVGSKLIAFAWDGPVSARGSRTTLFFHGSKPVPTDDSAGPRILLRPSYSSNVMKSTTVSFTDKITASLPFTCEVVLSDPNGIDVTHTGPDEGLTIEVLGQHGISRRNINTKFQFTEGDYRQGSALLSFDSGPNALPLGQNELVITSRDLLGNFSRGKFTLNVVADSSNTHDSSSVLTLGNVFNAPNPMRMGGKTTFYILPTRTSLDVGPVFTIKIYTLGGRLVRVIQNAQNPQEWDGRDQTGYPLPPNVYLYRVSMSVSSGFDKPIAPSKIQKLVIHPPR
jgi:hypothetical protein